LRGRRLHAARQHGYRARQRAKVTHQGFTAAERSGNVACHATTTQFDATIGADAHAPVLATGRGPVGLPERRCRGGRAERCAWCGAEGRPLVRFGYWRR